MREARSAHVVPRAGRV